MRPGHAVKRAPLQHSSSPTTRRIDPTRWTRLQLAYRRHGGFEVALPGPVGDEDQPGVLGDPLLLHGFDRHVVLAEGAGDGGQHAGPVGHLAHHVELRGHLVDRADPLLRRRADGGAPAAGGQVAGGVDEVAEHGRGGRHPARSPAVEHEAAGGVGLDEDGVERVLHAGQRMVDRHHGGMDPHGDLVVDLLDESKQLHHVAEFAGRLDVGRRNGRDPFAVHVAGHDLGAEGDGGEDRGFGGGVEPFDVGRRVTFGVAEALGFGQRFVERHPRLGHAGQHEVGGAVDDPGDAADPVAGQGLPQRPEQRDAAADRRLEEEVDAVGLGRLEQLPAEVGQQLLVGRDDRLAGGERGEDERAGRFDAADDLDDEVDGRVVHDLVGVMGETVGGEVDVAILGQVADGDLGHLDLDAGPGLDGVGVACRSGARGPSRRGRSRAARPGPPRPGQRCSWRRTASLLLQAKQIVEGLPADHQAGLTAAHEDDGRPGNLVVVAGHGVTVRAGRRGAE